MLKILRVGGVGEMGVHKVACLYRQFVSSLESTEVSPRL